MNKLSIKFLIFAAIIACVAVSCGRPYHFPFIIPWDDTTDTPVSLSYLNSGPAGSGGFLRVDGKGHIIDDTGRKKFWGVTLCFGACFPKKEDAPKIAGHIAKFGVNLVRFLHMDMYSAPRGIWKSIEPDREIDPVQMDRLDYFVAQLKENGIFVDFNMLSSRPFHPGKELHESIEGIFSPSSERVTFSARKTLLYFDDAIYNLKNEFTANFLTHMNPYTGLKYTDDPAVAFIEPLNESGLIHNSLNGYMKMLPDHYKELISGFWNDWLKKKYATAGAMLTAWKPRSFMNGRNYLKNTDFTGDYTKAWNIHREPEGITHTVSIKGGSDLSNAINFKFPEAYDPQLLMKQEIKGLPPHTPFKAVFSISGSKDTTLMVIIKDDSTQKTLHEASYAAPSVWSRNDTIRYFFEIPTDVTIALYNTSSVKGYIRISKISFDEALPIENPEKILYETDRLKLFTEVAERVVTHQGSDDWNEFLMETEDAYWHKDIAFYKNELGVRSLLVSPMSSINVPSVLRQFDVISDVQYWEHPIFLGLRDWDPNDWFLYNDSMIRFPKKSKIAQLSLERVWGKPFIITEYNHPHPNTYQAEAFYLASAYGALQDWDGIIAFSYNQTNDDWGSEYIRNFFDIDQNPVKMVSIIPSVLTFLGQDIKPAMDEYTIPISRKSELNSLFMHADPWRVIDVGSLGLNPLMGLSSRVGLALTSGTDTSGLNTVLKVKENGLYVSDTGELIWDVRGDTGYLVRMDTKNSKIFAGFTSRAIHFSDEISFEPGEVLQNGYCVLALTSLDREPLPASNKILITALGSVCNDQSIYYSYPDKQISYPPDFGEEITVKDQWGTFPSLAEGIDAVIRLPGQLKSYKLYSLDGKGEPVQEIPVMVEDGVLKLTINHQYKTLWYLLTP
ncbi:MAG: hypothetical protein JW969_08495 [Spirochaetales bacterium]|nr:hypothetical protein [Spirochaetales bacterium]